MVGFPAETNTSFLQTLNFIKDIRPMRMHVFSFSPRQHTVLADAQVKDNEKVKERSRCLRQLASSFALDYQKRFINKKLTIVAEKVKDGSIQGYSQNYIPLVARGNASVGSLSNVELLTTGNPAKGVVC
jgi:threonylcarbamoyladenosine tRNA methylthiotransferase MtaB